MNSLRLKLCIWMDIPSHYQSAFFEAINERADIDLKVIYLQGASKKRAAEGWREKHEYQDYERNADGVDLVQNIGSLLPEKTIHRPKIFFGASEMLHCW